MLDRILNPTPTIYKYDRFIIGFLPSMFLPLLSIPFFYFLQMDRMDWQAYMSSLHSPDLLSKVLSFGCIINLVCFFLFMQRDYFNAARGVIGATILYAIPVVVGRLM